VVSSFVSIADYFNIARVLLPLPVSTMGEPCNFFLKFPFILYSLLPAIIIRRVFISEFHLFVYLRHLFMINRFNDTLGKWNYILSNDKLFQG
jgi:hypothetical protein